MYFAATSHDFFSASLPRPPAPAPVPACSFVVRLVGGLAQAFVLDDVERELALLLLSGRTLGAIARRLDLSNADAQLLCRSLFAATGTTGREQLFELGLRLTAARELGRLVMPTDYSSSPSWSMGSLA